jgi:hypothetical protein
MRWFWALCFLLLCGSAPATQAPEMPLPELVASATEIAIAKVETIVGRKQDGTVVTKGYFRSGPASGNTFVAKLRIIEVLKGKALRPGMRQSVDLWPGWHMDGKLGPGGHHPRLIVFLKRSDAGLVPAYAPDPYQSDRIEKEVRTLIRREQAGPSRR